MINLNRKSGISLIVLVITIIVMIILAAAIILSLNSSGIIDKSNQAKTDSDKSAVEEYVATLNAEWELMSVDEKNANPYYGEIEEFVTEKLEEKGYTNFGVAEKDDGTLEVAQKGNWKLDKTVTDGKVSQATVSNGKDTIEVGSTVNYIAPESTGYTGTWRVLGVDNFGRVLLISDIVGNQKIDGADAENKEFGFLNAETILNNKCAPYADGKIGISSRSIKVQDINKLTTFNPNNYGSGSLWAYRNRVTFKWDGTNKPKYESMNGSRGNLNDSHANGFVYLDKTSNTIKKVDYATSGNIVTLIFDSYNYEISNYLSNTKIKDMILLDTRLNSSVYWFASRCIDTNGFSCYSSAFYVNSGYVKGYGLAAYSTGGSRLGDYGVRAVVTLAPNVSLKLNSATSLYEIR